MNLKTYLLAIFFTLLVGVIYFLLVPVSTHVEILCSPSFELCENHDAFFFVDSIKQNDKEVNLSKGEQISVEFSCVEDRFRYDTSSCLILLQHLARRRIIGV